MPGMRARTDRNHKEIMRAFRTCGCEVEDTSRLGKGFPDMVVDVRGKLWLVEVKDGDKPKSAKRLTPAEVQFQKRFHAHYRIIESIDDVVGMVGAK
jgi:hypothetical protein